MFLSSLRFVLVTAALAITSTQASPHLDFGAGPFNALQTRDLAGSSCVDFVYGAKDTKLGQVCVSISGGTLTITYPTLPSGGSYTDLHAIVQTTPITESVQGHWPYSLDKGTCQISGGGTSATCTIPVLDEGECAISISISTECRCPVVTTYDPITTSLVYTKTIYETHTTTCSTTPPPVTVSDAPCTNPKPDTITITTKTSVAGFTCTSPVT
ncbi:uncharacterized protein EI97DRAFT_444282 [Westerdykella ornata]|uniref:Uncharacterized protein n=1 Tax=Westerdykella ornata TaxID=318751 RepID=A0A6A6JDC8_WESOR|nr:uncharacterized protein EI97DRAFT_444282 [Westerdykella ornata]KAF2274277.1 hypothetical protein EI97DRAFT_444282 [Westerdykella ornata]